MKKKRSNKSRGQIAYVWMICLFAFVACNQKNSNEVATANASSGNLPIVEVEKLSNRDFDASLGITGSLEAFQQVKLHAMEGGIVSNIYVEIGDYVSKGKTIASLRNPELNQKYKSAQSEWEKSKASLVKAIALTEQAKSMFALKVSHRDRLKKIYDMSSDLVTQDQMEISEAEAAIAEAELAARNSEINYITAEIGATEANMKAFEERVNMLQVRAPFSGVITKRFVHAGAFVQNAAGNSSANPIAEMVDNKKLRLVLYYPESDLKHIQKGTPVNIDFPEMPGHQLSSSVTRMAGALDAQTKTIRAEIDIDNSSGKLFPGMYAKVFTEVQSDGPTLAVNKKSITAVKNQNFVFKVEDNIVKRIAVTLGFEDKDYIQVTKGDLDSNDRVIIQGKGLISDGSKVIAKESK